MLDCWKCRDNELDHFVENLEAIKDYKSCGVGWSMHGQWKEATKDLYCELKLHYDDNISFVPKKVNIQYLPLSQVPPLVPSLL